MALFVTKLAQVTNTTLITDVSPIGKSSFSVSYQAVIGSPKSYIYVWEGYAPDGDPIQKAQASATSGTVVLDLKGYDVRFNDFLVAYVVDVGGGVSSIASTAYVQTGQVQQTEGTHINLVGKKTDKGRTTLYVNFSTPNGNKPLQNHDWIYLLNGNQPKDPTLPGAITHVAVATDNNEGIQTIEVAALDTGKPYTLEYNPGYTTPAVSAFTTFIL